MSIPLRGSPDPDARPNAAPASDTGNDPQHLTLTMTLTLLERGVMALMCLTLTLTLIRTIILSTAP